MAFSHSHGMNYKLKQPLLAFSNLAFHILYWLSHGLYTVTSMASTTLSQQPYDVLVGSTSSLLSLQQSQGLHCHSHDVYKHSHGLFKHSTLVLYYSSQLLHTLTLSILTSTVTLTASICTFKGYTDTFKKSSTLSNTLTVSTSHFQTSTAFSLPS